MNSRSEINRYLAYCLAEPDARIPLPNLSSGDPEALLLAASSELILPSLYPRLASFERWHLLTPNLSVFLREVTQLNADRNRVIFDELRAFAAILNPLGIQPLVLKGVAYLLAGVFPGGIGSRYLADVDVVIPEAQMPAAQAALQQAGYRPDTADPMARFRHHLAVRKPGGISFELHHSLGLGSAVSRLLPVSEMLDCSSLFTWPGLEKDENAVPVQLRIPAPAHLVTHLILHSQIRHPYRERIWPPLRAMYDLLLLSSHFAKDLDWHAIGQRFHAAGQSATFKLHLLQVEQSLGLPCPLPVVLTPFERLRWFRRRLLNRWPIARFCDPTYLLYATLSRRFRLLQSILATPGGSRSAIHMFFTPGFYRRLLEEIV